MSEPENTPRSDTEDRILHIDALCDRFEDELRAGRRPPLDEFLLTEGRDRIALLRELVRLEIVYRRKVGERPTAAEYTARYPELGEWLRELLPDTPDPFETVPQGHPPTWSDPDPDSPGSVSSTTEAASELIGGKYKLLEVIGEGGMGSVYLARQTEPVKRDVALKLIKVGLDSKAVLARFDAERQALALMDHPNMARVYDGGTTAAGQPFFVMELVKGVPLTQFCDQKRLPIPARLELLVQVCQAVQHAHQKGIIHRDLKPGNVLVTEVDGRPTPKVIDFGVAKATEQRLTELSLAETGAIVGTPAYMSPEQADPTSMDIDTRTDVYALGVILYELLTGSPPHDAKQFKRGAILEMLRMVREVEPPRPSTKLSTSDALPSIAANRDIEPAKLARLLRGELDWVVMKALEKDRTRRYDTALGFAQDLQRYLADEVVEARPPSRGYRLKKFVRRNKGQVIATTLVLLTLVGGIVGTSLGMVEAKKKGLAEEKAKREAQRLLGQMSLDAGVERLEAGHFGLGLLSLTYAMTVAPDDPETQTTARALFRRYCRYDRPPFSRLVQQLRMPSNVQALAFTPDGTRLVAVGSGRVWILEVATGRQLVSFPGPTTVVSSLTISDDGNRVVIVARKPKKGDEWFPGSQVWVWNAVTEERISSPVELDGLLDRVHKVSRDGQRVFASWGWEKSRPGDPFRGAQPSGPRRIETGTLEASYLPGKSAISMGFNHDASRVLMVTSVNEVQKPYPYSAHVLDAWTGKVITTIEPFVGGDIAERQPLSPDGRWVVDTPKDGVVHFWNAETGHLTSTTRWLGGEPNRVVIFNADGSRATIRSKSDLLPIWTPESGRLVSVLRGKGKQLEPLSFSPDGRRLLTTSTDDTMQLWDVADGRHLVTLPGRADRNDYAISWAFSCCGHHLVTSIGPVVRIWETALGQEPTAQSDVQKVMQDDWRQPSPNGKWWVNRYASKKSSDVLSVWEVQNARQVAQLSESKGFSGPVFSPDSSLVVAKKSGTNDLKVWEVPTGLLVAEPASSKFVEKPSFSRDNKRLAACSWRDVLVWDARTGREFARFPHRLGIRDCAFSPDGVRIAIVGDSVARVWDIETQKPLSQPLELGCDAHFVTFNSDGTKIATAGEFAQVWDSRTGRSLTPRLRHDEWITEVEFSADEYRATTRTNSGKGFIWDLGPDERPAADLLAIAELMSGSRIENAGGVVALSADELMQRWEALRTKYPEEFTVTPAQTRAWRQREIRECMREGNLDAAQFHYWAAVLDAAQAGK